MSAGIERLWVRKYHHFLGNWNKEEDTVHKDLTGLTCLLYCKAVMGSFVTHGTACHHMIGLTQFLAHLPGFPDQIAESRDVKTGPGNQSIHSTHFKVPGMYC